jgi:anti-sigma factor RsiW
MSAPLPPPPDDWTCQELVEVVTDYLEGALTPAEAAQFEQHIALCAPCHDFVEQIRQTIAATGRLRREELAPAQQTRLVELFHNWRTKN